MIETKNIFLYVAALTYKRPNGLSTLLEAFSRLEIPEDLSVRFLIVDNDPEGSAGEIVDRHRSRFEHDLVYVVEPEPGIPAGRNRALAEASKNEAKFLCFTDDDAIPDNTWIAELLRCQSKTGGTITLGPTLLEKPDITLSVFKRFLARSLVERSHYVAKHVKRISRKQQQTSSFGSTSNLMLDVKWASKRRLQFSSSRTESGGSDSELLEVVRTKGGTIIWCSTAVVRETLPIERIGLRYQFRRSRSHGLTFFQLQSKSGMRLLRIPGARVLVGLGLMLIPAIGFASFSLGLHFVGMEMGRIEAWLGRQSRLYSR